MKQRERIRIASGTAALAAATLLTGCATPTSPAAYVPARPERVATSSAPPFERAEIDCLSQQFRVIGDQQVIVVGSMRNTTYSQYVPGATQPDFTGSVFGWAIELGLRPVSEAAFVASQGAVKPDAMIHGQLSVDASLTRAEETSAQGSFARPFLDLFGLRERRLTRGHVRAEVAIQTPHKRRGTDTVIPVGFATGVAQVTYSSDATTGRLSGSVLAASGGWVSRTTLLVHPQDAAAYAARLALVDALIDYLAKHGMPRRAAAARACLSD